jgi:hypothetical protein
MWLYSTIFAPKSFKVLLELKELKKLQQQIICSQGGQPLLGLVQNLASHSPNSQVKKGIFLPKFPWIGLVCGIHFWFPVPLL